MEPDQNRNLFAANNRPSFAQQRSQQQTRLATTDVPISVNQVMYVQGIGSVGFVGRPQLLNEFASLASGATLFWVKEKESPPKESPWLETFIKRVAGFRDNPPDLEGYADPPNRISAHWATETLLLASGLGLQPKDVLPSTEGGIGITFGRRSLYADIEILNTGMILAVISDGSGTPDAWETAATDSEINNSLQKIRAFITGNA